MPVSAEDHISRIVELKGQLTAFEESCPENFTFKAEVQMEYEKKIDDEFKKLEQYCREME